MPSGVGQRHLDRLAGRANRLTTETQRDRIDVHVGLQRRRCAAYKEQHEKYRRPQNLVIDVLRNFHSIPRSRISGLSLLIDHQPKRTVI